VRGSSGLIWGVVGSIGVPGTGITDGRGALGSG
jgi:hypothetical protein